MEVGRLGLSRFWRDGGEMEGFLGGCPMGRFPRSLLSRMIAHEHPNGEVMEKSKNVLRQLMA